MTCETIDKDDLISDAELPESEFFANCSVSVHPGSGLTLWHGSELDVDTSPQCKLRLSPDRPAIIGRFEGKEVHYLDPSYRATRLVPGTGQNIMRWDGHGIDQCVSRAHFMLRAASRGVLIVNGVPQPGGGLRTPRNGTELILPERRAMNAGEEYLVESGVTAVIGLPNGSRVQISAE